MNIKIIREALPSEVTAGTGGEYAISQVDIYVDKNLPLRNQRIVIIHAIIENYCRSWGHGKVEELTGIIIEALDELGEK